mmetsp:Transcript_19142/g.18483  ORF Transcript_19142/g.18483 Transcript_19142/m.18483 type:complete len:326 (+) Transcript_19142:156-1133(+)|eukprot:CAMPEP_0119041954 /NCGR_PEP_ID=MMETSP1177-20130426/14240_1 /TAXON_ID=2985 /ORGANISM="Ochromonas sp, Strain CCMP1899" /LENGTH=325 /DNA_ID=CAMNT_0007008409 /DNA_START=156 /DNA_END=1133 /DNA_ORIENTATION=+
MDQVILSSPPGDGISCVTFAPSNSPDNLLVSSWDSTTRLYDSSQNFAKATYNFSGACLTCCFDDNDGNTGYCGGLDSSVSLLDLSSSRTTVLGNHEKAVSCLQYCPSIGSLVSGSWDKSLSLWDRRADQACVNNVTTPGKVYSVSVADTKVVVATSERHILIYDVRNLSQAVEHRESPLRHQTRKIACSPDGRFFAVGSTEGRVAVEYFDSDPKVQARKYAFKCHRKGDRAFPVSSIAFHPIFGSFATGGCDGVVNIWDGENKKRLAQLPPYATSIASLAFNHDGTVLAVASSYTFEEGQKDFTPEDNVSLRRIDVSEARPRQKM